MHCAPVQQVSDYFMQDRPSITVKTMSLFNESTTTLRVLSDFRKNLTKNAIIL